jgi:heme exporter protein A
MIALRQALDLPAADDGTPVLVLDRVAHRFSGRWVLRGCSLLLEAGEAVALLGDNGAGKTTLLRVAATLLRPTGGDGRVLGSGLRSDPGGVRRYVGLLGHAPALYEDLTAAENLAFACRMRGGRADPEAIRRALDEVGLADHADARVRAFSSGMRRRVALARVAMGRPRLLLLDEPYASFDEGGIALVNGLIRSVCAEGGAALVATHDLPRALAVVDRSLRIAEGRVVPVDAPAVRAREVACL